MNDQQLDRNLRTIGKTCFVKYFTTFCDPRLSNNDVALLIKPEGYTWKSCLSRTSHARTIIKSSKAREALLIVRDSMHLGHATRNRAAVLLAALSRKKTMNTDPLC